MVALPVAAPCEMFPGLFTAPLRVADLFADPFRYTVPSYQRRYSWSVKEAAQLLDDLLVAVGDGEGAPAEPDYFLGTILLTDTGGGAGWSGGLPRTPRALDIVDGQQRLITLAILLCVLRDLASQEAPANALRDDWITPARALAGSTGRFRLWLRGSDGTFLADYVLRPDACLREPEGVLDVASGSLAILQVRDHFRAELAPLSQTDQARLLGYVRERCHVVAIVTTDIDHGHRMFTVLNDRGRPLAREDIIKAEILGSVRPDRTDAVLRDWGEIERRLGGELGSFLGHVRVIRGKARLPIIAGVRAARVEAGGSELFVSKVLLPLADAFDTICRADHKGTPESAEITRRLGYLSWLGSSEWVPAAIDWLSRHRDDPAQILRFLRVVEPFAYALRLLCIGAGKRLARFAGVLPAIAAGSVLDPARSPCTLSRDEQRHAAINLRNLHERHPQTCKLLLLRLNDEIAGAPQHLDPADWTVEHVLPQNPTRGGHWRAAFPETDERERLTRSLGNLVLISRAQNDKASNQDFQRKKSIFFGRYGEMPAITREIAGASAWTPAEIRARERRLLGVVARMWGLDVADVHAAGEEGASGRKAARSRASDPVDADPAII